MATDIRRNVPLSQVGTVATVPVSWTSGPATAALAADPGLLTVAVEELLRWVSPVKNMSRTVTTDVELRGQLREATR